MTTGKKKRMSMLDSLADAKAPAPATSMMSTNRALRSARDAVDSHTVWELDPGQISDNRPADRLDSDDVADLRDAIEANGQTVPILVRRDPKDAERYLLVYGRRRLEAIRQSRKVEKVRALVATLDDQSAVTAQISENMARRDLSYIEKALFAASLVENGYGTQSQVAEVLTVTKSSVSMALTIVQMIGVDLIRAIGPAHGVGRPRWEALGKGIEDTGSSVPRLVDVALDTITGIGLAEFNPDEAAPATDPSVAAFEAVMAEVERRRPTPPKPKPKPVSNDSKVGLMLDGRRAGSVKRSTRGLAIEIEDGGFATWLEARAGDVIQDLHARYKSGAED